MNDTQADTVQQPVESAQPTGIARRRLLRAGLAAGPVVLAVSGRSAMAGTCAKGLSPLAWNSLAPTGADCQLTSHTVKTNSLGKSPAGWAAPNVQWPSNINKNSKFKTFFTGNSAFTISNSNAKVKDILSGNPASIEAHLFAAYMNAKKDPSYAMTDAEVQAAYIGKIGTKSNILLADMKGFLAQTW